MIQKTTACLCVLFLFFSGAQAQTTSVTDYKNGKLNPAFKVRSDKDMLLAQKLSIPCAPLSRNVQQGDTDVTAQGQVSALQLFLLKMNTAKQMDAVGAYGSATQESVSKIQSIFSIAEVGVGEKTRALIATFCTDKTVKAQSAIAALLQIYEKRDIHQRAFKDVESAYRQKKEIQHAPEKRSYGLVNSLQEVGRLVKSGNGYRQVIEKRSEFNDIFYKTDLKNKTICIGFLVPLSSAAKAYTSDYFRLDTRATKCTLGGVDTTKHVEFSFQTKAYPAISVAPRQNVFANIRGPAYLIPSGATHTVVPIYERSDINDRLLTQDRNAKQYMVALEMYSDEQGKYPLSVKPQLTSQALAALSKGRVSISFKDSNGEPYYYASDAKGRTYCIAAKPEKGKTYLTKPCGLQVEFPQGYTLVYTP